MNDYYLTAYAISFGAIFVPSAILYVVLRHCFTDRTSENEERNKRDNDGL